MKYVLFNVCVFLTFLSVCVHGATNGTLNIDGVFPAQIEMHLAQAIFDGRCDEVKRLLAAGVDVNAKGRDGVSFLLLALFRDNKCAFSLLLNSGASPNVVGPNGESIMSLAAEIDDSSYL